MLARDLIKHLQQHPEARVFLTAPVAYAALELINVVLRRHKVEGSETEDGYVIGIPSILLTSDPRNPVV